MKIISIRDADFIIARRGTFKIDDSSGNIDNEEKYFRILKEML